MKYDWEYFYGKFAEKILEFGNKRSELAKIFNGVYIECGFEIPTYGDSGSQSYFNENYVAGKKYDKNSIHYFTPGAVGTIDPFSIFSYLNSRSGDKNRAKLCAKFNEKLDNFVEEDKLPKTFPGVPNIDARKRTLIWCHLNNNNNGVNFDNLSQSDKERIDILWDFFKLVLEIGENPNLLSTNRDAFVQYFDLTNDYRDVGCVKISTILFCIAPNVFSPLDINTKEYIDSLSIDGLTTNNIDTGEEYTDFIFALNKYLEQSGKNITDISYDAYQSGRNKPKKKKGKNKDAKSLSSESGSLGISSSINGTNKIYYGIPGCGKSHLIDDQLKGKHIERVVFHPDYTYSDFVGQILPVVDKDKIKYEFVPGPFTQILGEAFKHRNTEYYLIIEELNRGNAPAIFGDIFQLLDRDETGNSRYRIVNKDIEDCIKKEQKIELKEIYIPSNLSIYATMNTADQNVFTLDTAFQRRWVMEYVPDDIDSCELASIHIGGNDENMTWKEFHDSVNELISSSRSSVVTDDKRLGSYFCSENELNDLKLFANKVLKYLYDDAFKLRRNEIFTSDIKNFDSLMAKIPTGENTSFDFSTIIKFPNKD